MIGHNRTRAPATDANVETSDDRAQLIIAADAINSTEALTDEERVSFLVALILSQRGSRE